MKKLLLFLFLFVTCSAFSQTLVNTYPMPNASSMNYLWGITEVAGNFWIGSDYDYSGGIYNTTWMYKVSKTGQVLDSLQTPYKFNHGLAWDGTGYWIAEDYRSNGARLYKISPTGQQVDSIYLPSSMAQGIGGLAKDGNGLWFAVYYPDFPSYPRAYAYRVDLTTKAITDTIPLRGSQVQGIAVKGDTIFYVNDAFATGDPERLYAYSKITHDTVMSWPSPDPDQSCNPKGMYWDGSYLWLVAERSGGAAYTFSALYKYDINGAGTPILTTNSQLNFGDVKIGTPVTLFQTAVNTGTGKLLIDSVRIDNPYFSVLNSTKRDTLEVNAFKDYQIRFAPLTYGDQTANLKIYSNDALNPVKTVTVLGRGIYGMTFLSTNPSVVDFGVRRKNSTSYLEVTFTNYGSAQLKVDSLRTQTSDYTLEMAATPFNIDSVQNKTFRLWFKPGSYNNFNDTLRIYSNASNGSLIKLPLKGIGGGVDSVLGSVYWHGWVPNNPGTSYNNPQVRAMLPIDDVNGDGVKDLIVCTENYWTICYNGNSSVEANILWKVSTIPNNNDAGPVEYIGCLDTDSDLTGDGIKDVVIGTIGGSESVFLINGKTGQIVWENGDPVNYSQGDIMGVDAKRDFNNDGVKDVLATASGNETNGQGRFSIMCLNGLNGTPLWTINQASEQKLKYMICSTDDGGAAGSRVGSANEVIGFNKQGLVIWTFPTVGTAWTVRESPNVGGGPGSDVLVGTFSGNVYCLAGNNGQLLWQKNIGNVLIEDLRVIDDVNGNGTKDIAVSGIDPLVYALEGTTGDQIWYNATGGNILGISGLGDITGDGKPEIITGSLNNKLHIWNGANGTQLFETMFSSSSAVDMVSSVDKIDGNYSTEFAAGTRNGEIVVYSGGTSVLVPVEMTAFNASVNGKSVVLNWTTATELNNKMFVVERKDVGAASYTEVGSVSGNGTSTERHSYSFTDKELSAGKYNYRLKQIDFDGSFEYSKEIEVNIGAPKTYALEQNYPNPFNPSTVIEYAIPVAGKVTLKVFDVLGREVSQLVNEVQDAGNYRIQFNGSSIANGVYFYQLESGTFKQIKKFVLLK